MSEKAKAIAAMVDRAGTPKKAADVIFQETGYRINRTTLWRLSNGIGKPITLSLVAYALENGMKEVAS